MNGEGSADLNATVAPSYDIISNMRKTRVNPPNRCYHLISCVAHRAFFLDNDEKPRLVDLIRRVGAMRLNSYCGILLWQSSC